MNTEPDFFPIQSLTFDPELQIRVTINEETIALYAEQMSTEEEMKAFPAVEIYYDGVRYWLADGHHRRAAAEKAGHDRVWAIIKSGTRDDALWAAITGNGKQGIGLTRADKQRAIMLVVAQQPKRSNRSIAEAVGCGKSTVDRIRDQVSQMGHLKSSDDNESRIIGRDGKSYPAKQKTKSETTPPPFEAGERKQPDVQGDSLEPAEYRRTIMMTLFLFLFLLDFQRPAKPESPPSGFIATEIVEQTLTGCTTSPSTGAPHHDDMIPINVHNHDGGRRRIPATPRFSHPPAGPLPPGSVEAAPMRPPGAPGCPGPSPAPPVTVTPEPPTAAILTLSAVVLLLLIFGLKRKKLCRR